MLAAEALVNVVAINSITDTTEVIDLTNIQLDRSVLTAEEMAINFLGPNPNYQPIDIPVDEFVKIN